MSASVRLVAALCLCYAVRGAESNRHTPVYSAASLANAATNLPGPMAPLGLVSLYGKDLALVTRGLVADDIRNGQLPVTIIGTGVSISIDNVAVPILFVSPGQVNFLIPGNIRPGLRKLRLLVNGKTGPDVEIEIAPASPGMFSFPDGFVIATRADNSLVTRDSPAMPGETVVIYAAGLGVTQPAVSGLTIPRDAAAISARAQFAVLLNDIPVPDDHILYAGVTPGFGGLYQVNCTLPAGTPPNPEIRLRAVGQNSPPGLFLSVRNSVASVQ